ncbi:MAG: cation:dicarboxylase symporter family transporter [Vampirovibrionales bacterium]
MLFSTLVVGIASHGDPKSLGRIGLKTFIYFEVATTIALVIGLLVANLLQPGRGVLLSLPTSASADLAAITQNAASVSHASGGILFCTWCPPVLCRPWPKVRFCKLWCLAYCLPWPVLGPWSAKPVLNTGKLGGNYV